MPAHLALTDGSYYQGEEPQSKKLMSNFKFTH